MKFIRELKNNIPSIEQEVEILIERNSNDFKSVLSGGTPQIANFLDAMLLFKEFGGNDDFLDIIARYPDFIDSVRWVIEDWGARLSPADTLKDSLLGFVIKEWITRDDMGNPYYILPEEEIHVRMALVEDLGLSIYPADDIGKEREPIRYSPYLDLSRKLRDKMLG